MYIPVNAITFSTPKGDVVVKGYVDGDLTIKIPRKEKPDELHIKP
mgnify:CR=1 FL=1